MSNLQKELFSAIKDYVEVKGYSPSYRELRDILGVKSVSTISRNLDRLKEKGYVSFMPSSPRTLSINKEIIFE
ncbi:hypothetical protein J14TS2_45240 [Bacillus sp. J14TS2]|uniref:LexA family protein n=1 Tax=Bacillus sp. J14TS2 TaxID=2807188 RepID=UPI001B2CCFB7|nr:transcriptional regulator [Bacillus sp. J14TS2]GIN74049.1 hypothetical protein J14TS2_45240 [Bacillus sp. J14TS2]